MAARQALATAALAEHCPDLPVDELKSVFGARLEYLRTPSFDYGRDPFEGRQAIRPSPRPVKWVKKGSRRVVEVPAQHVNSKA